MPSHAGEREVYAGGHEYVREEGFGHELFNFKPFDGFCYGYVQSRSGTINLGRLEAESDDTFVDDVNVNWTARWNSLRHSHSPSESSLGESSNCKSKPSISCNVFPAIP